MEDQAFVQVRVDAKLKRDATDVLDEIGMDMPNAIRMFLKRIVIEKGLPFDAKLPDIAEDDVSNSKPSVIYYPAKECLHVPMQEYIDLLCKVPKGKITCLKDITDFLAKQHGVERVEIEMPPLYENPTWEGIPYWREVSSEYGTVLGHRFRCTQETQIELLEQEGVSTYRCGAHNKSVKVKNYKEYFYKFEDADMGTEDAE